MISYLWNVDFIFRKQMISEIGIEVNNELDTTFNFVNLEANTWKYE